MPKSETTFCDSLESEQHAQTICILMLEEMIRCTEGSSIDSPTKILLESYALSCLIIVHSLVTGPFLWPLLARCSDITSFRLSSPCTPLSQRLISCTLSSLILYFSFFHVLTQLRPDTAILHM